MDEIKDKIILNSVNRDIFFRSDFNHYLKSRVTLSSLKIKNRLEN